MSTPARKLASAASFQAFVNCYLREVDAGHWQTRARFEAGSGRLFADAEVYVIELPIPPRDEVLAIGVAFRSRVGRHTLTRVLRRCRSGHEWRPLDHFGALLSLIDALYAADPESPHRLELVGRLVESEQTMADYLEQRLSPDSLPKAPGGSFIASEQSTVLGHWLHPTPKSRQGLQGYRHTHYAPETGGRFRLHFFAARRRWVQQHSLRDRSAEEIARSIAGWGNPQRTEEALARLGSDLCLLPAHPLQAEWLLHQDYVRALVDAGDLVPLGPLGPEFTATSSVRTVYSEEVDFMLKLSIPVKITNSLRINLRSELGDSVWVSRLLEVCELSAEFPRFRPLLDPAYSTLALPGREETGFEVVFRENPFRPGGSEPPIVHSLAALVQDALPGQDLSELGTLVRTLAQSEGLSLEAAARLWFDEYFSCAVEPVIRIYDQHGIALEAHQQNSLLGFDRAGRPIRFYYRDIQGLALTESRRAALVALVPELDAQHKLFEDDEIVRNGVGYYLICNQLAAVMNRFALDGLLTEELLVGEVRRRFTQLCQETGELGSAFLRGWLQDETIRCKANLLTRVSDMDELQAENELAIYTCLANPLCEPQATTTKAAPSHAELA